MVLTNIELWAADGSSGPSMPLDFESNNLHARHLNPFDPRVVPQINTNSNQLSSNGYYGFSYVNAAHDLEINNNNNNHSNINYNNNNSTTYNLMANDVNGMNNTLTTATIHTTQQTNTSSVNFESSARADGHALNVARCKKRFFVMNVEDDVVTDCTATKNINYYSDNCEVSAKRCRFDDDSSAQYCNDFFQLPSTQIATQSCLMDTEEGLQQQQVDEAMFENNNIEKLNPQLHIVSTQHNQPELQSQELPQQQQQQLQHESQQQHVYHQQQHYQDIQIATINCHFNHNNNCDLLALNNQTCRIDLEKNTENVLGIHKPNPSSSIQNEHDKYDDDVANDFKVDDATLFAQLHGGCLHHHDYQFNSAGGKCNAKKKDAIITNHLQDNNYI